MPKSDDTHFDLETDTFSPKESTLSIEFSESAPDWDDVNLKGFALACIAKLIFSQDSGEPTSSEQAFLYKYYLKFSQYSEWEKLLPTYLRNPSMEDRKLVGLANKLNLSEIEILTTALLASVEEDPLVGRVIAFVQSPLGSSRPTLGLIDAAFSYIFPRPDWNWIAGSIASGKAIQSGILKIFDDQPPLPEQTLRIITPLVLALRNKTFTWPGTHFFNSSMNLALPDSIKSFIKRHAAALAGSRKNTLVLRSPSKQEGYQVSNMICQYLDLEPLFIHQNNNSLIGLGPLCLLNDLIPVFEFELGPSDLKPLPEFPGYDGPIIIALNMEGNVITPGASSIHWTLPIPNREERTQLWRYYLGQNSLTEKLGSEHMHSAGRIKELSELALRKAEMEQRSSPIEQDVRLAAWSVDGGNLGSLAQPITSQVPNEALILPKSIMKELESLVQRCRHRESLNQDLGVTIKTRYQVGVRALFIGPSGTGKTLVASWLSTQLGLPLFRVDIASVVSKYIGETEKNLSELLAKAEQSEVILLFDEADSLFGKRTDIKDSNDRFANSQTNYLLQRIEFYKGIVLLTSNNRTRFDSAFNRRLDQIIEFPLPASEERRSLWQTHLGKNHQISTRQFNQLAVTSDLAGGQIRNAVLSGAVQAKSESRKIQFTDLIEGLAGEYRKLGRQMPAELKRYFKEID